VDSSAPGGLSKPHEGRCPRLRSTHRHACPGLVEAGETFIPEFFKGKRSDLPRAARARGGTAAKRGLSAK